MTAGTDTTRVPAGERRWSGHRSRALVLRVALAVLPSAMALVAVFTTLRLFPDTNSRPRAVLELVIAGAVGFVVATIAGRLTVRALPLAALMRLSLAFPDQAPSRLKLAIRASSPKKLRQQVEAARHHGLSSDVTEAAGQVLLLTTALGEHDKRTRGHSERVRLFARLLGEEMGLEGDDLERLQWGALIHDIGKLTIPTDILNKPAKLDDTEWAIMSSHAAAGRDLAAPLHPFLGEFVGAADGHHEKWDGSGYPLGLRGQDIPLAARIVAVADAYEVMTAARAYKKPMSTEAARAELTRCAGTHFDPQVVRAWLNVSVGDVNRAAGPSAFIAGLPLAGELISLAGRTASQIAAVPSALASAAPAAATAGAMTVAAAAAAPVLASPPERPDLLAIDTPQLVVETTAPTTSTTLVTTTTSTSTTETLSSSTTAVPATTTTAPTTTTPTTTAPTTTTPTTTAPTTTTPTTTAPTTPTTAVASPTFLGASGADVVPLGPIIAGDDLGPDGPYGSGTFLFQDSPLVLDADTDVDGTILPAGTAVCVNLFLTSESAAEPKLQLTYEVDVLAVASTSNGLAATDVTQAQDVIWGPAEARGLDEADRVQIIGGDRKVKLDLEGPTPDSIRIFIDCS